MSTETGPSGCRFEGRVAVVTGSSSRPGIGSACATRLGLEGASVVINGRGKEQLESTETALRRQGLAVTAVAGSMQDDETAARLVDAATNAFGRIDLIVNTVGGSPYQGPPLSLPKEAYFETIALNTWCSIEVIQEAMRRGLADDGGAVVNISSGTVHKTTPSMIAYTAGKAALNALTRTLARELGPRGVRVNGVAPGFTRTSGTRSMWEADDGATAASNLLLGRLTESEDIADAVVFLLSDEARQITGVVLDVDGGNHLMGGWTPISTNARENVPPTLTSTA